jgi:hypothetical protein
MLCAGQSFAQTVPAKKDTSKLVYPFKDSKGIDFKKQSGIVLPKPSNIQRSVEFDPISKRYIIREKIGDRLYREPQYLSIEEYQRKWCVSATLNHAKSVIIRYKENSFKSTKYPKYYSLQKQGGNK